MQGFKQWNTNIDSCTPPFIQMAAKQALDAAENQAAASEMCRQFQDRRDMVVEALNKIDGVTCAMPGGAFYAFPNVDGVCRALGAVESWENLPAKVKERQTASSLFQLFALYVHGVATLDRSAFCKIGAAGQHFLRLSTASDMDTLREGLRRLSAAALDKAGFQDFVKSHRF